MSVISTDQNVKVVLALAPAQELWFNISNDQELRITAKGISTRHSVIIMSWEDWETVKSQVKKPDNKKIVLTAAERTLLRRLLAGSREFSTELSAKLL